MFYLLNEPPRRKRRGILFALRTLRGSFCKEIYQWRGLLPFFCLSNLTRTAASGGVLNLTANKTYLSFSSFVRGRDLIICRSAVMIIFFFFFNFIFTHCGFIDLRPISVSTEPSEAETILPFAASPVSVSFDTEMFIEDVERIFSVEFYGGKMEGDFRWEGERFYFYPAAGWQPGVRYTLSLNGGAYSKDGRAGNFSVFVPFYAISADTVPYLKDFYPADGSSTGVMPEDGAKIKLFFSTSMNKRSVEDSFSIDGISRKKFNWNNSDTELEIISTEALNAWSVYRWSLGAKALSAAGVPLPKSYSAQFTANKDTDFPFVKYTAPVLRIEGSDGGCYWMETGAETEKHLGFSQSIAVVFSKPMDKNSVVSGFRIEPSVSGIIEEYSPVKFIFSPLRDMETGTLYRLTISADTKDTYGLRLTNEYAFNFIVDIPNLDIVSIKQYGSDNQLTNITNNINVISLKISKASEECRLTFQFLPSVNDIKSRENIARSIKLEPFFPGTIKSAVLRWAHWTGPGNDTLNLEWVDVSPGTANQPNYYKLTIPGGTSGISNGSGSFLRDTVVVYLEITEV
ncbi:MAG: Ig-like domain-containing protein [Spirochaetaceae bacterium]|nr:Ig-like domain-containing protein [Spirochaetaceae bacterium]